MRKLAFLALGLLSLQASASKSIELAEGLVGKAYALNLSHYFKFSGSTTQFEAIAGSHWIGLASDGQLSGVPGAADEGFNFLTVDVSDGMEKKETVHFYFYVVDQNDPPYWTQDPIDLGTFCAGVTTSVSLLSYAVDPDRDPLSFHVNKTLWATMSGPQLTLKPETPGRYLIGVTVSDRQFKATAGILLEALDCQKP